MINILLKKKTIVNGVSFDSYLFRMENKFRCISSKHIYRRKTIKVMFSHFSEVLGIYFMLMFEKKKVFTR